MKIVIELIIASVFCNGLFILLFQLQRIKVKELKSEIHLFKESIHSINKQISNVNYKVDDIKYHSIDINEYCDIKKRMIELIEQNNKEKHQFERTKDLKIKIKKIPRIKKEKNQ